MPEDDAEQRSGEHPAGGRIGGLQHLKRRGRDDQAEHDHPAQPHDERQERSVTDDEHPLIIIAGLVADLDRVTDDVLQALASGGVVSAPALSFLLRRYRATERADVRAALEPALAAALQQPFAAMAAGGRAAFLTVFVEAAAVADDERVRALVEELAASLRADWDRTTAVEASTASVEACLLAADVLDPRAIVPDAIDELERVVAAVYRPGDGLAHDVRVPGGARGQLGDHVQSASALLTAYRATARIPYAMLAEELMQFARRTLWDEEGSAFRSAATRCDHPFAANCAAVRVWCRLARLHADEDYRAAAVMAPGADYRADAAVVLASRSVELAACGMDAAVYGLALADLLDV
jgi:hypothetical protein